MFLIRFDVYISHNKFQTLYRIVRDFPVQPHSANSHSEQPFLDAVNMACIWYWKPVRCLQRSAATTCLLRKNGFAAQLILGAKQMPFRAHAWVEIEGKVVNDKPYMHEIYAVLDCC